MKVIVFGRSGQVARATRELFERQTNPEYEWIFLGREAVDLERPETIREAVLKERPNLLVNTAAYTAVDLAETEREKAFAINAGAVRTIAEVAAEIDAPIVHFSTDYVYSGEGRAAHTEKDDIAPLGVYGESKARGDRHLLASDARALILRTSWVYAPYGKNFVRTMLQLGATRDELSVVSDQVGSPTSALDLARVVHALVSKIARNPGQIDWGVYPRGWPGRGELV